MYAICLMEISRCKRGITFLLIQHVFALLRKIKFFLGELMFLFILIHPNMSFIKTLGPISFRRQPEFIQLHQLNSPQILKLIHFIILIVLLSNTSQHRLLKPPIHQRSFENISLLLHEFILVFLL